MTVGTFSFSRATNQTTVPFSVLRDAIAPTNVNLDVSQGTGEQFTLTWSATETQSGLDVYEVAYRVDDGEWQSLYTGTDTSQVFAGEPGHVYTFRVRATDNVSNVRIVATHHIALLFRRTRLGECFAPTYDGDGNRVKKLRRLG